MILLGSNCTCNLKKVLFACFTLQLLWGLQFVQAEDAAEDAAEDEVFIDPTDATIAPGEPGTLLVTFNISFANVSLIANYSNPFNLTFQDPPSSVPARLRQLTQLSKDLLQAGTGTEATEATEDYMYLLQVNDQDKDLEDQEQRLRNLQEGIEIDLGGPSASPEEEQALIHNTLVYFFGYYAEAFTDELYALTWPTVQTAEVFRDFNDEALQIFHLRCQAILNFTMTPLEEEVGNLTLAAVNQEYVTEYVQTAGEFFYYYIPLLVDATVEAIIPPNITTPSPTVSTAPSGSGSKSPSTSPTPSPAPSSTPSSAPTRISICVPIICDECSDGIRPFPDPETCECPSCAPTMAPILICPTILCDECPDGSVPPQDPETCECPTCAPTMAPVLACPTSLCAPCDGDIPERDPETCECPTCAPTPEPSAAPVETEQPTPQPTDEPTDQPTPEPATPEPTREPTPQPTPTPPGGPDLSEPGCGNGSCGPCEGDCDDDSDCQGGLVCFFRPGGSTIPVPGCSGEGSPGGDYCVNLPDNYLHLRRTQCSSDDQCDNCQGDCDNDDECQGGLTCVQLEPGDSSSVPGCGGMPASGLDYCASARRRRFLRES
ncbi:expressed unknown protein [Seminavis robusta]|uniref:Uncharacterized protein n=1 Tax=Seminavis robusta TaxID=568900 RepID=A0A9N8E652_9STRA|nr:expressed unknown protein [Seminavis robusta]|eukprot:Sro662_g183300.1 n/a (603) ;mRNA; r:4973-7236